MFRYNVGVKWRRLKAIIVICDVFFLRKRYESLVVSFNRVFIGSFCWLLEFGCHHFSARAIHSRRFSFEFRCFAVRTNSVHFSDFDNLTLGIAYRISGSAWKSDSVIRRRNSIIQISQLLYVFVVDVIVLDVVETIGKLLFFLLLFSIQLVHVFLSADLPILLYSPLKSPHYNTFVFVQSRFLVWSPLSFCNFASRTAVRTRMRGII